MWGLFPLRNLIEEVIGKEVAAQGGKSVIDIGMSIHTLEFM